MGERLDGIGISITLEYRLHDHYHKQETDDKPERKGAIVCTVDQREVGVHLRDAHNQRNYRKRCYSPPRRWV